MKYLVTGAAGFIGSAVVERLVNEGKEVLGIDNLNDYYDVSLKNDRLARLQADNFSFVQLDISNTEAIKNLFREQDFDYVVHLAAQAGVRYSIDNPLAYANSNLVGH